MSDLAYKLQSAVAKNCNSEGTKTMLRAFLMRTADFAYLAVTGQQVYEFMEQYLEENFDYWE